MIGADRKVQRVTSAQAKRMLIGESGRSAEMKARNRQNGEALRAQPGKPGQSVGPADRFDLLCPQLDRQSRGEFRYNPVADRKLIWLLIAEPSLDVHRFRLAS